MASPSAARTPCVALAGAFAVVLAVACAAPEPIVPRAPDLTAVSRSDFALLRFLEGRWQGRGPDGVPFWEEFRFAGPTQLEVRRFGDGAFEEPLTVGRFEVVNGALVYRAGHHRWVASELTAREAEFAPIEDAPTHVAWRVDAAGRLRVVHAWTSAARSHQLVVQLARVAQPAAEPATEPAIASDGDEPRPASAPVPATAGG